MRVPILTYHSVNIAGNEYSTNDHIAFAKDLRLITAEGWRIVPLHVVVDNLLGACHNDLTRCLALTCDDGADFDFFDLEYPPHGKQRSFFNCLTDFQYEFGTKKQPQLHLTSFVIASPEARTELDKNCLTGCNWMNEHWWKEAQESGLMAIENHSWDHNHANLPLLGIDDMTRGSFHEVNTFIRAQSEIVQAAQYINEKLAPHQSRFFCYPYSHVNDYLRDEYFPRHQKEHGVIAAFGDGAVPITEDSNRWNLPRYICGFHWKSPRELLAILDEINNSVVSNRTLL